MDAATDLPVDVTSLWGRRLSWVAAAGSLVVASFAAWLPLVTVLSGRPGAQPRVTILAAGDERGALILILPAVLTAITLVFLGVRSRSHDPEHARRLATAAKSLSVLLLVFAIASGVTFFIGFLTVPSAALLLVATLMRTQFPPLIR